MRGRVWCTALAASLLLALGCTSKSEQPGAEAAAKSEAPASKPQVTRASAEAAKAVTTKKEAGNRTRAGVVEGQKKGDEAKDETSGLTPAELTPVEMPETSYPTFEGPRVALVHTENVIGELEPCG